MLASATTACVSISAFLYLVRIPIGIRSSTIGLKICAMTAATEKFKSIIKKKEKEA